MNEIDTITLHQAAKGSEAAFKRLYDSYAPFVWKVVYRAVHGDQGVAAEVVQDTFVRVHAQLRSFKGGSALSTWIYRIAWNCTLQFQGRRARGEKRNVEFSDTHVAAGEESALEKRDLIETLLATLTVEERFLITALGSDEMSFEELAQSTGSTAGALRTRVHRIRKKLLERYNESSV